MSNNTNEGLFQIRDLLSEAATFLTDAGIESPRLEAQILLAHQLQTDRTALLVREDEPVSPEEAEAFRALVRSRGAGEPLQYLTGGQEFMGRTFRCRPGVLVPRDDTGVLVEAVLEKFGDHSGWRDVADIGTGTGIIGITLKLERPALNIWCTDVSARALELARDNARQLGADVLVVESDLLNGFVQMGDRLDVVVSNPPYIRRSDMDGLPADVRREPALALDGGADGLVYVRRLAAGARDVLRPGGMLAVEIGWDQGEEVAEIFAQTGYNGIEVRSDWGGRDRVVLGMWGSSNDGEKNQGIE